MKKITVVICVIGLMLVFLGIPINTITSEYTSDNSIPLKLNDCPINITVHEAWDLLNNTGNGIQIPIDVRSENEWNAGFIDTPWPEYARWYSIKLLETEDGLQVFMDMYTGEEIILYCRLGVRSLRGSLILCDASFNGTVYNMLGGITAWKAEGYPIRNNTEPDAPEINGPSGGVTGEELTYNFSTQDTEGDNVSYWVDWNDTTTPEWIGPFAHDEEITLTHTWEENGTYLIKAKAKDIFDAESDWEVFEVTIIKNHPPDAPSSPTPPNGAIDVIICPNLSWSGGDPDGNNVTYDVYFGDHPENMQQVVWNQTETWFQVWDLDFQKTYYWYVVAWDEYGLSNTSDMWHFTTEQNYPPNPAENPHPFDGDPAVPTEGVVLCWNGSDPNICDTLRYDLYFDDVNPPLNQRLAESYENCWEIPYTLGKYKTYYWRVDTYDKMDEFTPGKVWSFTCGDIYPPTDPIIDGKKTGKPNEEHDFTFVSTDPENHSIWYHVQWGDGTEEVTGLYPNGTVVTLSHSWIDEGIVTISAMACDEYNRCSNWSEYIFTVPRNKVTNNILLFRLLERFPLLQKLLILYFGL